MSRRAAALGAALLIGSGAALAESWDATEVAEARRLQAEEAARAAAYRARVARGDVRSESAPMPRRAPQTPGEGAPGDPLRDAADLVDELERWLRGVVPRDGTREELRRRARERRSGADGWWEEEKRRLEQGR